VIQNLLSVTETGFVVTDAAFGLDIVLRIVDGSTPVLLNLSLDKQII
jgi:hypothetical protein